MRVAVARAASYLNFCPSRLSFVLLAGFVDLKKSREDQDAFLAVEKAIEERKPNVTSNCQSSRESLCLCFVDGLLSVNRLLFLDDHVFIQCLFFLQNLSFPLDAIFSFDNSSLYKTSLCFDMSSLSSFLLFSMPSSVVVFPTESNIIHLQARNVWNIAFLSALVCRWPMLRHRRILRTPGQEEGREL
jgi:hypothetical protein